LVKSLTAKKKVDMYNGLYNNLVVIGGNAAGLAAASQARRKNPDIGITVLESGKYVSYGSCGLPYFISGYVKKIEDLFAYPRDFFKQERNIDVLTGHRVVGMDPAKRELLVNAAGSGENKVFSYDRLVIASGASPVIPRIKGAGSPNVFNFWTVDDARRLKDHIEKNSPGKAAIIGGGQVGLLMAEALKKLGISVTVIEAADRILGGFEPEISTIMARKSEMEGIEILTGTKALSINDSSVTIENSGEREDIPCGFVLFAAGIRANTGFLEETSMELGKKNAIIVDNKQQTSYMNIYACGDCATVKNLVTGKQDYIPTAGNGVKAGRIAGENAAGGSGSFPGSAGTVVDKILDLELARTGIGSVEAIDLGFEAIKLIDSYASHAGSVPGAKKIAVIAIVDTRTRKLLGAQMIGAEGVGKRIDVFAAAITNEMTVDDIYMLDLSYSPAISTVWDPVNKICGKAVLALDGK
jgi:NADPH-dependent 2,4-dienoyl-CoA reductase/sulfur reductase-like enzyme